MNQRSCATVEVASTAELPVTSTLTGNLAADGRGVAVMIAAVQAAQEPGERTAALVALRDAVDPETLSLDDAEALFSLVRERWGDPQMGLTGLLALHHLMASLSSALAARCAELTRAIPA
jgi:hypothetical protein